jgi:putative addiction module component (TIGR02574 family)
LHPFSEILKLSVAERIQLAEDIWDGIAAEPAELPLAPAQRRELQRRSAAYREDPIGQSPWRRRWSGSPNRSGERAFVPAAIQPEASEEVSEAVYWYESRECGSGREFLRVFRAATAGLRRNPFLYQPAEEEVRRVS